MGKDQRGGSPTDKTRDELMNRRQPERDLSGEGVARTSILMMHSLQKEKSAH